ncbi:MAG: hypothetical protein ACR2MQ_04970 [Gemmatimonadaceae bacterium]
MTTNDPKSPGVHTEADVDARVVMPYLAALGIQPDQIRAQRTFSIRLGRTMVHSVDSRTSQSGRLDYLVVRADGRPLFVVELKRPSEALTDDDRDQGISYARLLDQIAPIVLVTNGTESRLYDSITREQLQDPAAAALNRGDGHLVDDDFVRVRAEALEHFVGYSPANVAAFSRMQRDTRMATLRGDGQHTRKYERDLYIPRDEVRRRVRDFLQSQSTVFALGGASGSGKTNEMCALAEELGQEHVVLFFSGAELVGSFSRSLADEFDWRFSEALPLVQVCRRLARLSDHSARPVLIFIDAVDEAGIPELPQELAEIATRLDAFAGRIRLFISAKPHEWPRFASSRGNPSPLGQRVFHPDDGGSPSERAHEAGHASAELRMSADVGLFEPGERDSAIARYASAFGLQDVWSHDLRELARDPFMLRIIAEVSAAAGALPQEPGERELIRRYVEQKLARTSHPDRARLEIAAVAEALVTNSDPNALATDAPNRRRSAIIASGPYVSELALRRGANLPLTAPVATELTSFGLLIRSQNADGVGALAFAYDRVRDYAVAVLVLRLPQAGRGEFRDAALACLRTAVGAAALLWYLPYTTNEQWEGFIDAAREQVERVVTTYNAIRERLAPGIRAAMDPHDAAGIGACFSATRRGAFALAFYDRRSDDLPRACFDPVIGVLQRRGWESGRIPVRLLGSTKLAHGFWFLRDPEMYAAAHARSEIDSVLKDGGLAELDPLLIEERIVALTSAHASEIGYKATRQSSRPRFADHFVGRNLFPLDLRALRRLVQVELALQSYKDAHMRERIEEKRREHQAGGNTGGIITATSSWEQADLDAWRELAERDVDAGGDFTHVRGSHQPVGALAAALNTVLRYKNTIEEPLLPPPDAADSLPAAGANNFEGGYTDKQLALLLETLYDRALRTYDSVVAVCFGEELRAVMRHPPTVIGVLCYRRPVRDGPNAQFAAVISSGPASDIDCQGPRAARAIAITLPSPTVTVTTLSGPWDVLVTSETRRFRLRIQRSTGIASVVWPWDAPPLRGASGNSWARLAPVRALVYSLVSDALRDVSAEHLRNLAQIDG